jgi:hypothetical protein
VLTPLDQKCTTTLIVEVWCKFMFQSVIRRPVKGPGFLLEAAPSPPSPFARDLHHVACR